MTNESGTPQTAVEMAKARIDPCRTSFFSMMIAVI